MTNTPAATRGRRLVLEVMLAFAFAGLCAFAAYGYLDHHAVLALR